MKAIKPGDIVFSTYGRSRGRIFMYMYLGNDDWMSPEGDIYHYPHWYSYFRDRLGDTYEIVK